MRATATANVGASVGGKAPLVHLAAPGGSPIPGIANQNGADIAQGSGTSQAAAFVAGTAAALANCYPNELQTPAKLKRRLMVTSRPTLATEEQSMVAAGILDYNLALKDPKSDWYLKVGTSEHQQVRALAWCAQELELSLESGESARIRSNRIRRVFKTATQSGQVQWYVFADGSRDEPLALVKYGPGQLTADSKLLKLAGTPETIIGSATISDILLADREIGVGACGR